MEGAHYCNLEVVFKSHYPLPIREKKEKKRVTYGEKQTDHCGKSDRDEYKGSITQVYIQSSSNSCWYNCERQIPSVGLVIRKVNKTTGYTNI